MRYADRTFKRQVVDHRKDVLDASRNVVSCRGSSGRTETSPGQADNPKSVGKLMGKVIKHVGRVPDPGQKEEGWPVSTPVKHFDVHAR